MKSNFLSFPQNFEPVPYPKGDYGKFYTGDSYIVLNVSHEVLIIAHSKIENHLISAVCSHEKRARPNSSCGWQFLS